MENVKTDDATLSSKYQILIPKGVRDALDLKAGQKFTFLVKGDLIQMVPKRNIQELKGALKDLPIEDIRDRRDSV